MKKVRYIFVTGGVASSLGKGVSIASIGALLEARGFSVTIQKMDPYINIDPGTMSPFQHGEVYVTEDGAETDLDLGYYERFTSANLGRENSVSTGQIYHSVISRERRGEYLGRTVQVIPHITNEIKNRIQLLAQMNPELDFVLVEIGGTVGDIESVPFLEAIRQFRLDQGGDSTMFIHLTLVPSITDGGEIKTKPTQHSVKELLKQGIQPDILICRTALPLDADVKEKISLFCNVTASRVFSAPDIDHTIYEIPQIFHSENLDEEIIRYFRIENKSGEYLMNLNPMLSKWDQVVDVFRNPRRHVKIAVVGKYMALHDAYRSLYEALTHGGFPRHIAVDFIKIDSEKVEADNYRDLLKDAQGILVPGGFGERGVEGKLLAIRFARENKIPYFGICLGMQCAVIEFARNVLGFKDAHSTEFDPDSSHPVISLMEEQTSVVNKGGTMRLGAYPCKLREGSLIADCYMQPQIQERHRHRFEFNNKFRAAFEKAGMLLTGLSPDETLVETVELDRNLHPFFVGTQYHPEFKSKPLSPHPVFTRFIEKSAGL
ncbi:MAG: CTP synthase [Leptospiraceae bacterium]|nr:CTP synthase [Leptospiraceae bacterium]